MKKIIRDVAAAVLIVSTAISLVSCKDEQVRSVDTYDDDFVIEHYTEGLGDYKSTEYERIVISLKYFDIGPHEPQYRGVIYLDEEAGAELMDKYEWNEVEEPEFEFDEVDISDLQGPWYTCSDFGSDLFTTVSVNYVVFNGEAIVYDVHVM